MDNREDIKPKNLTLHEFLARKTAVRTMVPESTVEKILTHEKKSALQAFHIYSEVEISGFGKFILSQTKLKRRIARVETIQFHLLQKSEKSELDLKKIAKNEEDLLFYRSKVKPNEDRPEGNSGGVKEHLLSSQGGKGINQTDPGGETSNL